MSSGELPRLARTVAQLRPGQIAARARLRAQRTALEHGVPFARQLLLAGPDEARAAGAPGWPTAFTPLDAIVWRDWPGAPALLAGELSLLGVSRVIAPAGPSGAADWTSADWTMMAEPLLWRFHLYYWDWAWGLAAGGERAAARAAFPALWDSWAAAVRPGRGASWHPYPTALRAWSLCGVYPLLVRGGLAEGPVLRELSAYSGFLRRNTETDLGGNHLVKDLKALIGLAVFFGDDALLGRSLRRLRRQLSIQVLPDGGHYERAPAYHCQVLGDLIDVAGLLAAAGTTGPTALAALSELPELSRVIAAMRRWLGAVLTPAGGVPMLNDGFPVCQELLTALRPQSPPPGPLQVLPDTGLVRASVGRWHLLADAGLPCPRELPGHAHADTLSCLVFVDSQPLLVDTGTSGYAPGPSRDRERSTAAHNTLEVDGTDSTEVWGAFRAGRRARVTGPSVGVTGDGVMIEAAHDGYRHLPGQPVHRRRWQLQADELRIDDTVTGRGRHRIALRWHLAKDALLRLVPGGAVVTVKAGDVDVEIAATGEHRLAADTAEIATGFGQTFPAPVLTCVLDAELPVRISTTWRRAAPRTDLPRRLREADRPAGERGPGCAPRCAVPGPRANRGTCPHDLICDLARHRAGSHRAGAVEPARQGTGAARPSPAGAEEGPHRGPRRHRGRGAQPAGARRAARLLGRRGGGRGGRRRQRDPAGPARRHRRRRQGEPRGVPGGARVALRGGAGEGQRQRRGVHHDRRHRAAQPADRRRGTGLEGRGDRPRPDRAVGGATGDGGRL
jgi:uncharacterized heparinase superfamily protein